MFNSEQNVRTPKGNVSSSYLNIKNLYRLDYMEKGRIIFLLVGLDHPAVSVARYPYKRKGYTLHFYQISKLT